MKHDTHSKFSPFTIILHWTVAVLVIGLLAVGFYMSSFEAHALYPWHKSFGVVVLCVAALRIVWRIKNGWPIPVGQYKKWEHVLAKLTHYVLITATILMPLSGVGMSAIGGHGVKVFGWQMIGRVAPNKVLAGFFYQSHEMIAWVILGALTLHIAGALKHHIVDKDGTLMRMLGQKI